MFVDTHAHVDLPPLCDAEDDVVRRAREAGGAHIVTIGIHPRRAEKANEIAPPPRGGYAAAGGPHPHDASECSEDLLARLDLLSRCDKVVAVGETGLDFYRDRSPRDAQRPAVRGPSRRLPH